MRPSDQSANHLPRPLAVEGCVLVHTRELGIRSRRFELHPAQRRLAALFDEHDGANTSSRMFTHGEVLDDVDPNPTPGPGDVQIAREQVLPIMAAHPKGILVPDLCRCVVGKVEHEYTQRLYALLAREIGHGFVQPSVGRNKLRFLTEAGQLEAKRLQDSAVALQRAARQTQAKQAAQIALVELERAKQRRINSVFDFAKKVELGVMDRLPARVPVRCAL